MARVVPRSAAAHANRSNWHNPNCERHEEPLAGHWDSSAGRAVFPEHFTSFCGSCVAQLCGVQQLLLKIGIQRGKIVASEDYKITLELFSTICICAVLTVVQVLAPPGAQETQCVLHTEVLQCSKRGKSRVADDSLAPELVQAFCPSLVAIKTVSRGRRSSLA